MLDMQYNSVTCTCVHLCTYLAAMLQDGHHIGFMVTNPLLSIIVHACICTVYMYTDSKSSSKLYWPVQPLCSPQMNPRILLHNENMTPSDNLY